MNKLRIPEGEFTFAQLAEANAGMGSLTLRVLFSKQIAEGDIVQAETPAHDGGVRYRLAKGRESRGTPAYR